MASIEPLTTEQEAVAAATLSSSDLPLAAPTTKTDGEGDISDILTNLARPKTSATLTIRVIKSFEFRSEKSLVLHDINLLVTTIGKLKEMVKDGEFAEKYQLFIAYGVSFFLSGHWISCDGTC